MNQKNITNLTEIQKEDSDTSKKNHSTNYINYVEQKFKTLKENLPLEKNRQVIQVGDIIRLGYNIPEGEKERIQYYEGVVISKKNRGLGKTFTLRRTVQGIGLEQVFLLYSPKITSITKKQSSKVRRAKLYFIRSLTGKAARLKTRLS